MGEPKWSPEEFARQLGFEKPKPPPVTFNGAKTNPAPSVEDTRTKAWAEGVLAEASRRVATAPVGARNGTLNKEAWAAYHKLIPFYSESELEDAFLAAAAACGLITDDGEEQCRKTIRSGFSTSINGHGGTTYQNTPKWEPQVSEGEVPGFATNGSHSEEFDWGGVDGARFILDVPKEIPALWGGGENILWARGESLMIAGGQGLGKTTLAGQIIRAMLTDDDVLGLPVQWLDNGEKILYLAMDRPRQIARSLNRQFDETDREVLQNQLIVRPGPPIADMASQPGLLPAMAAHFGVQIVFVDSLKDAVLELTDDRIAGGWNRARQTLLSAGVDLCELHHNTKHKSGENWNISDVYGSNWITAGVGSVVMLTGEPGDPIVGFRHIKQPSDEVGPYQLSQDQMTGYMRIQHDLDLVALAESSAEGLTAKAAATVLFDTERPSRAEVEKARRRLVRLAEKGLLAEVSGGSGGGAPGANQTVWFPVVQMGGFDDL